MSVLSVLWDATRYSVAIVGGLTFLAVALLYAFQDKLLYFPDAGAQLPKSPRQNPRGYKSPGERDLNYQDFYVDVGDGTRLHSWLLLQPNSEDKITLLYFHGNAGNIGFRMDNLEAMYKKLDVNVMIVDYRGYGDSTGVPSENGLKKDAEACLDALRTQRRVDPLKIGVFGRSLGGAVALHLAHARPNHVRLVVVENTFTSISEMVDVVMPFLASLKPFVLRIGWDSLKFIAELQMPILFISGLMDELVPPAQVQKLHDKATSSVLRRLLQIPEGMHNDTSRVGGSHYYRSFRQFLSDAVASRGSASAAGVAAEVDMSGEVGAQIPIMPQNVLFGGRDRVDRSSKED